MSNPSATKNGLQKHQAVLLACAFVFLLAFAIRFHQARYEFFFEFDGYFHSRMTAELLQHGQPPERDPLAYYYAGGSTMPQLGWSFWYLNAALYKIGAPFVFAIEGKGFPLNAPYDEEVFYWIIKILPAFYGALISGLMYLLGRELLGHKAGLVAGVLAAVVPSFVYRTMGGWLEPSSFGFIWLVGGFWLLVRATKNPEWKTPRIIEAVLAGVLFSIMAISWPMYLMIPLILVGYLVVGGLLVKLNRPHADSRAFAGLSLIAFGLFLITTFSYYGVSWVTAPIGSFNFAVPDETGALMVVAGLALLLGLVGWFFSMHTLDGEKQARWKPRLGTYAGALLILAFIALQLFFLFVPDIRGDNIYLQTVGEENTGKQFFGNKYSGLIVLPWIGMLLLAYRMYRKPEEHTLLIVFGWTALAWAMAFYKLKFTFGFGLPIALMGAVVFAEIAELFGERRKIDARLAYGMFAFILLLGLAAGTFFIQQNTPNIEYDRGWKNALIWIRTETPVDSSFMNWWNQGHWLTFIGQRKAMLDNRNWELKANAAFARMVVTRDTNEGWGIVTQYHPNFIILDQDMFSQGYSFGVYADQAYPADPRLIELAQAGPSVAFACSASGSGDAIVYDCGGNRLSKTQFEGLPTTYSTQPVLLDERTPAILYRSTNNDTLFIVNTAVNDTMLTKMWFGSPDLNNMFESVYDKEGIKILRVHYP